MKKVHICLISAHLLPNLIPILMDKPDEVILISSKKMNEQASLFEKILSELSLKKISVIVKNDFPDAKFTQILDHANKIKEDIKKEYLPDTELILNITGGTKLMCIGMRDSLCKDVSQIIYTDTDTNQIEYLPGSKNNEYSSKLLQSVIDIELFLKCYGVNKYGKADSDKPDWIKSAKSRYQLSSELAENTPKLSGLIKIINTLSSDARDDKTKTLKEPRQELKYPPNYIQKEFLQCFKDSGLIEWDGNQSIIFKDYDSAKYLGGGWIEEYVYNCVSQLKPNDVRNGVEIQSINNKQNELDTLVVHKNRLLAIECKTVYFDTTEKENEVFYKFDSISKAIKGLFGNALLVCAQKPSENLKNRLKDRNIGIVLPEDLSKIGEIIKEWMEKGKFQKQSS